MLPYKSEVTTILLRSKIKIIISLVASITAFLLMKHLTIADEPAARMAAIAVLMASLWLTEAIPVAITALLPAIFFPVLGILDSKQTAIQYMDPIIFLFIGGFIIAYGIEKWMLHERISLRILMTVGSKPSNILLGTMITTFLISMWISNTATTMMLFASVMAIITRIETSMNANESKGISTALLLGLAYSASIGGMGTLVGTPTNMIFYRTYKEQYPMNTDLSFFSWFVVALPIGVVLLFITFFLLRYIYIKKNTAIDLEKDFFRESYRKLGRISYEEKIIGTIFTITAVLWFTRADVEFGGGTLKGWNNLFGSSEYVTDGVVAILMATLLFFIPSKKHTGESLLVWNDIAKLPFDIILLFGGGFALAKGMEVSGLSTWLASNLGFASQINIVLFILLMCALITIISEFASNVACIQLMLPILISLQKETGVDPLLLMIPATLAASLGFMLPVATAPNTIVYSSKRFKASEMVKAGFWIDLSGIIIITIMGTLLL